MSGLDWRRAQRPSRGELRRRTEEDLAQRTLSTGGCWCGQEIYHDWPDKEEGAPHPR